MSYVALSGLVIPILFIASNPRLFELSWKFLTFNFQTIKLQKFIQKMSQDSAEEIKNVIEGFLERSTSIWPGRFPIFGMIAGSKSFNLNLQSSDTVGYLVRSY